MERRRLHLELLRIMAIFFVVMNHTGFHGQLYFVQIHEQPIHWLFMALSALHKAAVPLFFMCSGALLLEREESLTVLLKKRVLRFALVLLLFSLLAYFRELVRAGAQFSPYVFLTRLYSTGLLEIYWYLYNYLAYLLVLPFLRRMARAMDDREYLYLAILWLLLKGVGLLPLWVLGEDLPMHRNFALFIMEYTVFFPLMGYYLEHRLGERFFTRRVVLLSALAAALSLAIMCLSTERWCALNDQWPADVGERYFGALNFVVALALFFQAKSLFRNRRVPAAAARVLTLFGSCSFGVYLLHQYFLDWTLPLFDRLESVLGTYPGCLAWVLCICLLGTGAAWLMKKVPGLKKLI